MDQRLILAAVTLAVLAALGSAAILGGEGGDPEMSADSTQEAEFNKTEDGTRYTVHPSDLVMGCSGKDCIPSIENPEFESVQDADQWISDSDRVMKVELDGETRAYPLRILARHEIVNDQVSEEPLAVTYCPLCRSGLVFDRTLGNRTLELGVSGRLLNANLVMYDRQTDTFWSQATGRAIVGPLVPERLELVSSQIVGWGNFSSAHPDAEVLARSSGRGSGFYRSSPYEGYASSDSVGFGVRKVNERLPSKEIVYGVSANGSSKAYTEEAVRSEDLVQDTVGGEPVMLVEDQEDSSVYIYSRHMNGRTLEFSMELDGLVDSSGTEWSFEGESEDGRELEEIDSHGFYWFAWSQFNPGTELYGQ